MTRESGLTTPSLSSFGSSIKYEDVYARLQHRVSLDTYTRRRPHSSCDGMTPDQAFPARARCPSAWQPNPAEVPPNETTATSPGQWNRLVMCLKESSEAMNFPLPTFHRDRFIEQRNEPADCSLALDLPAARYRKSAPQPSQRIERSQMTLIPSIAQAPPASFETAT